MTRSSSNHDHDDTVHDDDNHEDDVDGNGDCKYGHNHDNEAFKVMMEKGDYKYIRILKKVIKTSRIERFFLQSLNQKAIWAKC